MLIFGQIGPARHENAVPDGHVVFALVAVDVVELFTGDQRFGLGDQRNAVDLQRVDAARAA
jgi:hypothetical protein